ncbi:hypothetical protein E2C01_018962 [Portunus trituberculatus]|uniref:Uncharacterized protein n=1 Tax=Portunus trituberculatus TaxID=210409 RepID=A0A5B7DXL7_PORTR|nr:hypothetical protein [Portunus trituberculatus]
MCFAGRRNCVSLHLDSLVVTSRFRRVAREAVPYARWSLVGGSRQPDKGVSLPARQTHHHHQDHLAPCQMSRPSKCYCR